MTVEQPVRKSAHARTKSIFKPTVRIVVLLYIEPRTLKAALKPKEPQPLCQNGCYSSVRWLSQGYSVEMQPAYREGGWGREERKGPNYEREFMGSEWLFRAREILLP